MGPGNRHYRALPIGARPSVGAIVSFLSPVSPARDAIALFHVVTDRRDRLPIRLGGVRVSLREPPTTAEPIPQTYKRTPVVGAAGFRVRDIHDIPSTEARTAFARARNRAARCRRGMVCRIRAKAGYRRGIRFGRETWANLPNGGGLEGGGGGPAGPWRLRETGWDHRRARSLWWNDTWWAVILPVCWVKAAALERLLSSAILLLNHLLCAIKIGRGH